jgi:hypothetical protein
VNRRREQKRRVERLIAAAVVAITLSTIPAHAFDLGASEELALTACTKRLYPGQTGEALEKEGESQGRHRDGQGHHRRGRAAGRLLRCRAHPAQPDEELT